MFLLLLDFNALESLEESCSQSINSLAVGWLWWRAEQTSMRIHTYATEMYILADRSPQEHRDTMGLEMRAEYQEHPLHTPGLDVGALAGPGNSET